MIRVALDAMGSDRGVAVTVEGAADLSREDSDVHVLVVGDREAISARLDELSYDPSRLTVVHAADWVRGTDKPREALSGRTDTSIGRAATLVATGEAHALVSAGNTGAVVLAAAAALDRLGGISRAGLAAVHPTEARHGPKGDPFALMLDIGATVKADARALVGFAIMGAAYSSIISEIERPRVGLLSNGSEASKGTPAIVEAHQMLLRSPLHFGGNIEGLDIPRGSVDVVVCDGFLGNVVLKMLEGVSDVFQDMAREASTRSLQARVGLSMLGSRLRQLRRMTDWKLYGGAPLLGLDGIVIKAHGRSEQRAIRNALKVAAKAHRGDLLGRIRDGVATWHAAGDHA